MEEIRQKIRRIDRKSPEFPKCLTQYPGMPGFLYVIGELPNPAGKTVAIVGARACTNYGKSEAERFAEALTGADVQIISGMALGVDTAAHRGALRAGGKTYAVLGCGADRIYPPSNRKLYEQIIEQGGILSEYAAGTPPYAYHFPVRNRIISGLADLVIVIEARRKSGSLITADIALEMGKSVYAVPGRNTDSLSEGTNHLIEQGAGIACHPDQILEELNMITKPYLIEEKQVLKLPESYQKEPDIQKVYDAIDMMEKSPVQIIDETNLSPARVSQILMKLCFGGYIGEGKIGFFKRRKSGTID